MNFVKFFKDVPLCSIPQVAGKVAGTEFFDKSLEDIRQDERLYYDFIAHVIKQVQE